MNLPDFIEHNLEPILSEWEQFAHSLRPAAEGLSRLELRDLAEAILQTVCDDMRTEQSEAARERKSISDLKGDSSAIGECARGHASERLTEGFTLDQLMAEYRALRASVIRQWRAQIDTPDEHAFEEVMRFNEAIDESLVEAVGWYNSRLEDARDLLNGVLAHDLRNPLGSMLTGAEVLLRDESLASRHTATAARIRNSGTRMQKMINDLLDFTRTRLGTGLPIDISHGDLGRIVREVVEELAAHHPDASIAWSVSGDLSGTWDVSRIEQMLSNLISNAIHHAREGSQISVHAQGHDGEVTAEVHNEGGVIPEEEQEVIFDPLRRAAVAGHPERTSDEGVGLGLYIARQIAEAHEGTVDLESSEEGTTFTIRVPRRRQKGPPTAGMT